MTTSSSPRDGSDAQTSNHVSDGLATYSVPTTEIDAKASSPRDLIPLLELIARKLDQLWSQARSFGLPGEFAQLNEASHSVHASLAALREHSTERNRAVLFDQDAGSPP